ncbi:MAG: pyridoxal phosphate-dependent aminotransferase, partial [Gemmatimonadota bacterium]
MKYSPNVQPIRPSATLAVAARAGELRAAGRAIVDLSAGQPDSGTPDFIREAGADAIRAGKTRYTPAPGIPELRRAIAADLARQYPAQPSAEGVVVSAGAKQSLFNAAFTLFGPGDKVLVPTPYWTSYPFLVHLARAEPVEVPPGRGGRVDVDALERAWDPAVRGLILNSPSNPAGTVHRLDELEAVARWAADRDVWILSDEIYARICYVAERAPGMLDLSPELRERVVVINGASKAFAMTGWRIGYTYSAPELARKMAAVQSHITTAPATMAQWAALTAYTDTAQQDRAVAQLRDTFARRRTRLLADFAEHLPGVGYIEPEGAFYLYFRIDGFFDESAPDSVTLCTQLLERAGVAVVPGVAFGDDRYARLSFAASDDDLAKGVALMAEALVGASA